ncbi:MAG: N-acetylmuramidase domain-containing protein [Pseudomonadota bacterium]
MTDFPLVGTGKRLTLADYTAIAAAYKLPVAHLRAVVKIEAAGSGFTPKGLLKSLYEGHVMYRNATGAVRDALVRAGLAWRRWTRARYKRGTKAQHDQIKEAVRIAGDAGFKAASYGAPQVLGENHGMVGFRTAEGMVAEMLKGEREQVDIMMRFCRSARLLSPLRHGQWSQFAGGYNGPGYKKNRYHIKLAEAARLYARSPADGLDDDGNVRTTTTPQEPDDNVKFVQDALNRVMDAGLVVDGWPGPNTSRAVLAFQRGHEDLANDGIIGPHTMAALREALEHLKAKPAKTNADRAVGTVAGAGGAAVVAAGGLSWQTGLILLAIVLVAAGVFFGVRWFYHRTHGPAARHEKRLARGETVTVEAWEDRPREFAR